MSKYGAENHAYSGVLLAQGHHIFTMRAMCGTIAALAPQHATLALDYTMGANTVEYNIGNIWSKPPTPQL